MKTLIPWAFGKDAMKSFFDDDFFRDSQPITLQTAFPAMDMEDNKRLDANDYLFCQDG